MGLKQHKRHKKIGHSLPKIRHRLSQNEKEHRKIKIEERKRKE